MASIEVSDTNFVHERDISGLVLCIIGRNTPGKSEVLEFIYIYIACGFGRW